MSGKLRFELDKEKMRVGKFVAVGLFNYYFFFYRGK